MVARSVSSGAKNEKSNEPRQGRHKIATKGLKMGQSYNCHRYHIVFSTKNRERWLEETIARKMYTYLAGIFSNKNTHALLIGGMPDHVHILCSLPAKYAVADIIGTIKSNSSKWFKETFKRNAFAWQEGYASFTVSQSKVNDVWKYIENQKHHHTKFGFKKEYLSLLDKHEIEYDPKYVFD